MPAYNPVLCYDLMAAIGPLIIVIREAAVKEQVLSAKLNPIDTCLGCNGFVISDFRSLIGTG